MEQNKELISGCHGDDSVQFHTVFKTRETRGTKGTQTKAESSLREAARGAWVLLGQVPHFSMQFNGEK